MSNIISGYQFVYESLSDVDREKLTKDIDSILSGNIKAMQGRLAAEVEKAVTALYHQLICNPWGETIQANSGNCEFINSIEAHVWNLMLNQNPAKVSKYRISDLMEAWQKQHPEEFKAVVGADVAEKLKTIQERLEFEIQCSRRHS